MKKILCMLMVFALCATATLTASAETVQSPQNDYQPIFEKYLREEVGYMHDFYEYEELYRYYSEDSTSDEPDYVLIEGICGYEPMPVTVFINDYAVNVGNYYTPFKTPYYVIVPSEGTIYNIEEMYEAGIENLDYIFTDYELGELMGDMDDDEKITIKDATYLQKCLAGMEGFTDNTHFKSPSFEFPSYYYGSLSDFNFDDVVNVKDVTAIQKYIAGIE